MSKIKFRPDFDPKQTRRRIGIISTQINYLGAVDLLGGVKEGKKILDEMWTLRTKALKISKAYDESA